MSHDASLEHELERQLTEIMRGCAEVVPQEGLRQKLAKSLKANKPLRIKFGADPSRPDLHLGHTVVLQKLKVFQDLGHEILFLIGDFTARIGDPTGKNQARLPLTADKTAENAQTYQTQVFKILDPQKTQVLRNSDWLGKLGTHDFLGVLSHLTVQQLQTRDDFAKRLGEGSPIYGHEFLYPALQGYDSVALKADIELGGTDQTFNLLMGRHLQKAFGQEPQVILTMPLLEGLDGVQKMSKSAGNVIGLSDSSKDFFGKIMSTSDILMVRYYELLSGHTSGHIQALLAGHPMEAKKQLGVELVDRFFGSRQGAIERTAFETQFSSKQGESFQEGLESVFFESETLVVSITQLLVYFALVPTKAEAKRLLAQGGIKRSAAALNEDAVSLSFDEPTVFKVGKLRWLKVQLVKPKSS